jgi:hypothetical protein
VRRKDHHVPNQKNKFQGKGMKQKKWYEKKRDGCNQQENIPFSY